MIYHVVQKTIWDAAKKKGFYEADSLADEGFIHLSIKEQVKGVLERYYQGQKNLLLLHIDETKLTAALKYELSHSVNDFFPHLFGRLNLDAVVDATLINT
jgi:uncharacterized protein (DUF952 family)